MLSVVPESQRGHDPHAPGVSRELASARPVPQHYSPDAAHVIRHGDWRDLLSEVPDDHVALTLTSPPYCMGKSYETTRGLADFQKEQEDVIPRVIAATRAGGSICWQVGYHVNSGVLTPLDYIVHGIISSFPEVALRNRLIWTFNFGQNCSRRLSGRHEVVLWYTKGADFDFDLDSIRVPQKYPGKKHHKGVNKGKYSANPRGKNPGDVWQIPNVKANSVEKTPHPCQFPIGLAQGLVRLLCPPGHLVLDPYLGSGTTAAAAALEGRRFAGAEMDEKYYRISVARLDAATTGTLRYRPYGKSIAEPTGAVSRRPPEFG